MKDNSSSSSLMENQDEMKKMRAAFLKVETEERKERLGKDFTLNTEIQMLQDMEPIHIAPEDTPQLSEAGSLKSFAISTD